MEELVLNSSCLSYAGYDRERLLLEVTFKSDGTTHRYMNVPEETWAGLQTATSVGNYFNTQVRNRFQEISSV